jgi:hypothetical protein
MLRLTWFRSLAPLVVAWLGLCASVDPTSRDIRAAATPSDAFARPVSDATSMVRTLGAGRQPVSLRRISAAVSELRSVDIDADGRPDLVATGSEGLRTWLNVGSGRFVEHAATRTLLRHKTTPGFTTRQRTIHADLAALIGDRQALSPSPGTVEREIVCTFAADIQSSPLSARDIVVGGSRAPPSSSLT